MSNSSPLGRAPVSVPRPAPSPLRVLPRLVNLPSADLVELPRAKPPSVPPPLPKRRPSGRVTVPRRAVGDDLAQALFDASRALDLESDALSAARFCLDALHRIIPCRVSVVHWFDISKRDFVVVHARGEESEAMVLERSSHDDPLLRIAMQKVEPFAWEDLRRAPVTRLTRFSELGNVATALVCPLVAAPRWLGAIELVDPVDRAPFRTEDIKNARYVADRYTRFLKSHSQVVDVSRIARFAAQSAKG